MKCIVSLFILLASGLIMPLTSSFGAEPWDRALQMAMNPDDSYWDDRFPLPGASAPVNCAVGDGSGRLYVAGDFVGIGKVNASHIACYDGSSWATLGEGINGTVKTLAIGPDGSLYAGGYFSMAGGVPANCIARWDGMTWSSLGSGMDRDVEAIAVTSDGTVYAGGQFTKVDGNDIFYLAKWNGTNWSSPGGVTNNYVLSLVVSKDDTLYVGGMFTLVAGCFANSIARFDGTTWTPMGDGMDQWVEAIAVDSGGLVYAAGTFYSSGSVVLNGIAKWDGSAWNPMGSGLAQGTKCLAIDHDGSLYAGGEFTTSGGADCLCLAKWQGESWSSLGGGMNGAVYALAFRTDESLYTGGYFTSAGGTAASYIARWDGSTWSAVEEGIDKQILAVAAASDGSVYIGGYFTNAGSITTNHIAKWDGYAWSALADGMDGQVRALATDKNGILYAGGSFTTAGRVSAPNAAKWDGSTWSPLCSSMTGYVNAIAVGADDTLYLAGSFTMIDGSTISNIAMWDGSGWLPLGSGITAPVLTLALDQDGTLYAGGNFYTAGGIEAYCVAKWDGNEWGALGLGLSGESEWRSAVANSMAIAANGDLYVGGWFYGAGESTAYYIAKWDGSTWYPLGTGMNDEVFSVAMHPNGDLYAVGGFTSAGGAIAQRIARWDGTSWSPLGNGLSDKALALAISSSGTVYCGGDFGVAGDKVSGRFAIWHKDEGAIFTRQCSSGWNMVTSNVKPADPALAQVMAPVIANLVIMKNDLGKIYWPELEIDQIGTWNFKTSYQIYLTNPDTLIIKGEAIVPESTPIELHSGWNMVAYLRDTPMAIETALEGISEWLLLVKNGKGDVYWPEYEIDMIEQMKPGEGYWIYVIQACTLVYPANNTILTQKPVASQRPGNGAASVHYPTISANTGEDATLLALVPGWLDGVEIAAWTTGKLLIGSGIVHQGQAILILRGDDPMTTAADGAQAGETVVLTLRQPGSAQDVSLQWASLQDGLTRNQITGELTYQANKVWIVSPNAITDLPDDFDLSQNYPNPFNPKTTIRYKVPTEIKVELGIYNLAGTRVRTLVNRVQPAGDYIAVWDARDEMDRALPSGIYWLEMRAGEYKKTVKLSVIR